MKKKRIQPKTCYMMGLIACAINLAAGLLMALDLGAANLLVMSALACEGGMFLFLSLTEPGAEKKGARGRLLLLFAALLFSAFQLPPLNFAAEALVIPLLAVMCGSGRLSGSLAETTAENPPGVKKCPLFWALVLLEVVRVVLRSMGIIDFFAPHTLQVLGVSLILVSVVRFGMLLLIYKEAAKAPPLVNGTAPRLR